MSPLPLSDTAQRILSDFPPFLQGSATLQRTMDAMAREVDRIDAAVATLRTDLMPDTSVGLLRVYEALFGLPIAPIDKTLAQRQQSVSARLIALASTGSGLDWEATMNTLIGTAWSYEEHDELNPSSPPAYSLRITLPYSAAMSDPAAPTLGRETLAVPTGVTATPSATGGTLASGTRYYKVVAVNGAGLTLGSAEVSAVVVGPTGSVLVSWSPVAGANGYRLYRGTAPGAESTSINAVGTNTNVTDTGQAGTAGTPPVSNTAYTNTGTLAAGTYYYRITATNAYGETLPSPAASITIGTNHKPLLTWAAVPGATGYRVYRGPSAGATMLAAILGNVTTYTDDGSSVAGGGAPPIANTTRSTQASEAETLARDITPANLDLIFGYGVGFIVGISEVGEEPL